MTGSVRFVLGGRVVEAKGVEPTVTVLQWLRANGRVGTKEGCAEGDCGACTVVVGDLVEEGGPRIRYRALNACILFLPMIDGKLLLTVEDLAGDGELHPVQTALVEEHASQCGFCTPGFAMALFAHAHREGEGDPFADDAEIHDALAGNLCRCTGYRPIVDAARRLRGGGEDRFDRAEAGMVSLLRSIRGDAPALPAHALPGAAFHAPRSAAELTALLARHPDATLVAGATDVGLWVTKQHKALPMLIHLAGVAELQGIVEAADHLDVGAAVTYADLLPVLDRRFPPFADLVRRIGAAQVRNAGTLGGNIANGSPIGDSMPALLALGASLVIDGTAGRRELPLADFYHGYRRTDLKPGEFVARVRIPTLGPDQRFATWKVAKRRDQDISAVCAAFLLTLDGDTVAGFRAGYGGMAATPARARTLEAALTGKPWTAETIAAAGPALAADFRPIADMRASDRYRASVALNLLTRFFLHTTGTAPCDLEAVHA